MALLTVLLAACQVYNADYACEPVVANPSGGVTVSHCAWLDEDAGDCG